MKKPEKCFVIMPFSETTHGDRVVTTKAQWDHVYEAWIKRAVRSYKRTKLSCERSASMPGNFVRGIVADLAEAFLVIADVTGNKANVFFFYELGTRHALRTGTILITQHLSSPKRASDVFLAISKSAEPKRSGNGPGAEPRTSRLDS